MQVDTAPMRIVNSPARFDVIVTENMFGDIITDDLGAIDPGRHGHRSPAATSTPRACRCSSRLVARRPSTPAQGIANPIGMILSTALLLRYSLKLEREAAAIENGGG